MEYLQRLWHASRERLPFRTAGSVPFFGGLAHAPIVVETSFPEACLLISGHGHGTEVGVHRFVLSIGTSPIIVKMFVTDVLRAPKVGL